MIQFRKGKTQHLTKCKSCSVRKNVCLAAQSSLTLWDPMDCSPPGLSVHGDSPSKNTGVGCHTLLQGIFPTQGEPRSPRLQVDSLLAEPPGKPKNTGVGSLSRLQGIFLTQEWNQGLLHCRWVLYHLSYLGSPLSEDTFIKTTFSGLKEWEYWQNRRIFKRVSY